MPSRSILLRLLLCLCLVVQAAGAAWASARMPSMDAVVAAAPSASHCPGHAKAGAPFHDAAAMTHDAKAHGHAPFDCCKAGGCAGTCGAALAALAAPHLLALAVLPDATIQPVAGRYEEPALAHRIRPPIA